MKIAFPVDKDLGMESPVFNHFGSAPIFIIVDSDSKETESVSNKNLNHTHGNCQPLLALGNNPVDAVIVGGIGGGALRKLNTSGVKAFRGVTGSVTENLDLFNSGKLPQFTMDQTCMGHDKNGHCAH